MRTLGTKLPLRVLRPLGDGPRLLATLQQALAFASAEPNAAPLWAQVREALTSVLMAEWQAGRLLGGQAHEAFFVRCDASTMTAADLDGGRLVVQVGVARLKPAEFELITLTQATAPRPPV